MPYHAFAVNVINRVAAPGRSPATEFEPGDVGPWIRRRRRVRRLAVAARRPVRFLVRRPALDRHPAAKPPPKTITVPSHHL